MFSLIPPTNTFFTWLRDVPEFWKQPHNMNTIDSVAKRYDHTYSAQLDNSISLYFTSKELHANIIYIIKKYFITPKILNETKWINHSLHVNSCWELNYSTSKWEEVTCLFTSRGTARFGSTSRLSMMCGLAAWAASNWLVFSKVTKPKPRERFVLGSRMTTTSTTSPYFSKWFFRLSSVVS